MKKLIITTLIAAPFAIACPLPAVPLVALGANYIYDIYHHQFGRQAAKHRPDKSGNLPHRTLA